MRGGINSTTVRDAEKASAPSVWRLRKDAHGSAQAPDAKSAYALLRVRDYLLFALVMLMPVVNMVLLLIWSLGGCRRYALQNLARAGLCLLAVFLTGISLMGMWGKSLIDPALLPALRQGDIQTVGRVLDDMLKTTGLTVTSDQMLRQRLLDTGIAPEEVDKLLNALSTA